MWVEAQVLEGTDAQVCAASLKGVSQWTVLPSGHKGWDPVMRVPREDASAAVPPLTSR